MIRLIPSTLIILKPDAMKRHLDDLIINRFLKEGYVILRQKKIRVKKELVLEHYQDVIIRVNLPHLEPALIHTWENQEVLIVEMTKTGGDLIMDSRHLIGATDPKKAEPSSIRGTYGIDSMEKAILEKRVVDNLVHASDSLETAKKEIKLWFDERWSL